MARNTESRPTYRRTFLREWREHRGKTQAQVVAQLEFIGGDLPTTTASLSRLENGKQPYSQPIIEALAEIYDVDPEYLIARDPTKDGEVVDFVGRLDERQQQQVLALAKAMTQG